MENIKTASLAAELPSRIVSRSIGKKFLMAFSGIFLVLYVIGHMLGNWQIYMGRDQINSYAEFLHSLGPILWLIRAFLALMLIVHVWMAITLSLQNYVSRPIKYRVKKYVEASLASRTMIWTGIGVFLFVTYHLLHFTFIVTNPQYAALTDPLGRPDVYSMVVLGFQNYIISAVYIVALAIVAYHGVHAFKSMFQTAGWNGISAEPVLHRVTIILAWVIFLGYISIPISIMLGWVGLPEGM
jgi:succinate dehydrogenase / fumarate reductase cytochrome b subunit